MKVLVSCLLLLFLQSTQESRAQVISTICGLGASGYGGDGGPATAAQLNSPIGIALDADGNIFIADQSNFRIRKIDTGGVISTVAGTGFSGYTGDGGPATAARLGLPKCVAVDAVGNLFISDNGNQVVRMVDTLGIITTVAGNGYGAGTGIGGYSGDGGPATNAMLYNPFGVAVDATGKLYIADADNYRIRVVDTAGVISTFAGTGFHGFAGGGIATAASLGLPKGLWLDSLGNLFIGDQDANKVLRVGAGTDILTVFAGYGVGFSGDGGPATSASLNIPLGGAADTAGNIFFADYSNMRVRKVDIGGMVTTVAGNGSGTFAGDGGPALFAGLNAPTGVAIDRAGNIFIAESAGHRIRKVSPINSPPYFAGGHLEEVLSCSSETVSLDTQLAVVDSNIGQALTWNLVSSPLHGLVAVSYSTTSTGGLVVPPGITYTPGTGYYGPDTFSVGVSDGMAADTITIAVFGGVHPLVAIAGADTLCAGSNTTFVASVAGGSWSSSGGTVTVSPYGLVSGLSVGAAAITYTISDPCGTTATVHELYVQSCPDGLPESGSQGFVLHPDPGRGVIELYVPSVSSGDAWVAVCDPQGRVLMHYRVPVNRRTIISTDLPAGLYLIYVRAGATNYFRRLIVY